MKRWPHAFQHAASKFLSQEHADYGDLFNIKACGFGLSGLLLWLLGNGTGNPWVILGQPVPHPPGVSTPGVQVAGRSIYATENG